MGIKMSSGCLCRIEFLFVFIYFVSGYLLVVGGGIFCFEGRDFIRCIVVLFTESKFLYFRVLSVCDLVIRE